MTQRRNDLNKSSVFGERKGLKAERTKQKAG